MNALEETARPNPSRLPVYMMMMTTTARNLEIDEIDDHLEMKVSSENSSEIWCRERNSKL